MNTCPTCKRCYEDMTSVCSEDDTTLVMERPGTRLLVGKYRLECLLGRGDKGIAYVATDTDLDCPVVAVELHGTQVIDDPHAMQRFHREARQAARASGHDVADIYDYGPLPNGGAYVVMERIEQNSPFEDSTPKSPLLAPLTTPPTAVKIIEVSPAAEKLAALPYTPATPLPEATPLTEGTSLNTEDETLTFELPAQSSIATPNSDRQLTKQPVAIEHEATVTGSREVEAHAFAPDAHQAESDVAARLAEDETRAFSVPKAASRRVVVIDNPADVSPRAAAQQNLHSPPMSPSPVTSVTSVTPPTPSTPQTPSTSSPLLPNLERSAHPSTPIPTPAPAPIVVKLPNVASEPKSRQPLVYAGLAAAIALSSAAAWFAFNRQPTPAPNMPVAAVATAPTTEASSSLPTTDPPTTQPALPVSAGPVFPTGTIADNPPPVMKTRRRAATGAKTPRAVLNQTFKEWIAATIQRDADWHMSFYLPVLTTFYRQKDVPIEIVREEKDRLFAEAQAVDVSLIGKPQITFSERGQVATMRIRIRDVTEGTGQNNSREIRRELRWRKTDDGWKIFSERDL